MYSLVYVGIGGNLNSRLRKHTGANIGSSTFRMAITALIWKHKRWKPEWTDRPYLNETDLKALGKWQKAHLRVQWCEVADPRAPGLEGKVVGLLKPPFNREHNEHHPYYATMGTARSELRVAALKRPSRQ